MRRALFVWEQGLLSRLIDANQKHLVPTHLEKLEIEEIDEFGSLRFRPLQANESKQAKLPAEAAYVDVDGVEAHALVFACDGQLDEIQIYKDDGSRLTSPPKPEAWSIFSY